jgi:hypothetical protein
MTRGANATYRRPGEIEEGSVEKGSRRPRTRDSVPDESLTQRLRRRFSLRRGQHVGIARSYEEVDPSEIEVSPPAARSVVKELERQELEMPQVKDTVEPEGTTPPGTRRVKSVTFRQPSRTEDRPRYAPDSKEGIFYSKAEAMGHRMGDLAPIGLTTDFRATCEVCGVPGRIVVQFADMMVTHSADYFSGRAFEKRCTDGTGGGGQG